MKKLRLLILAVFLFFMTGCPRYDAVRRLSTEQLNAQKNLRDNLKAYYVALDHLLDQQVIVARNRLDAITTQQVKLINQDLAKKLAAEPNAALHPGIIATHTKMATDAAEDTQKKKQQIDAHVQLIKAKHEEIRQAYDEMYKAQVELDRWIQLKKVDEVIAEQISNTFKINQDKITSALDTAAKEAEKLKVVLP